MRRSDKNKAWHKNKARLHTWSSDIDDTVRNGNGRAKAVVRCGGSAWVGQVLGHDEVRFGIGTRVDVANADGKQTSRG